MNSQSIKSEKEPQSFTTYGGPIMLSSIKGRERQYTCRYAWIFMMAAALVLTGFHGNCSAAARSTKQKVFKSPEEAVETLFKALKNKDSRELSAIFGPDGKSLIYSGDDVADKERHEQAVKMFEEKYQIVKAGDRKAILELGANSWPLPIPIVEEKGNWRFDTKQGKEEILNRRIGKNEIGAIQTCLAYVDAQREYASEDRNGDGSLQYAQRFLSEPGKKDGLYWDTKEGEKESPVGIFMANARQEGYTKGAGRKPAPFHGYIYRILKSQGENAPGGAFDYVVKGKMIGGFALVAYPAKYGSSGIMTFMVNHEGVVYQKDLGRGTESVAKAIKLFNPDKTWQKVE
ncbi:MAG: DUF2950 domain-containing protein [Syntrophobacteraceae bacterium]|jgi:hypothetical protein